MWQMCFNHTTFFAYCQASASSMSHIPTFRSYPVAFYAFRGLYNTYCTVYPLIWSKSLNGGLQIHFEHVSTNTSRPWLDIDQPIQTSSHLNLTLPCRMCSVLSFPYLIVWSVSYLTLTLPHVLDPFLTLLYGPYLTVRSFPLLLTLRPFLHLTALTLP